MSTTLGLGRGTVLRCRSWRTEGLLRMLENTMANAERPKDLVVYGGSGRAARDWPSLHAIVATLLNLKDDETLIVQSGRPVAVFPTFEHSPRVLIANANLVPRAATAEHFRALEAAGLTMHGQYTAGSWAYIGSQGIVQGTYETFAAAAASFGGTLAGRVVLTAGLGGMSRAQGPAIAMNGGAGIICEVRAERIDRALGAGQVDQATSDLDEAWRLARDAADARRPLVVALHANAAEVVAALLASGRLPDLATDQTAAHDLLRGYLPAGLDTSSADALRTADPDEYMSRSLATVGRHVEALLGMARAGVVVFEYGNDLRQAGLAAGVGAAVTLPGFVPKYVRSDFVRGRGPFRWVALSGEVSDRVRLDAAARELFPDDVRLQRWLDQADARCGLEGLPARICWLGYGARAAMGREINRLVATGELAAPVAITRDHLDGGSCAYPSRETEGMPDGSDEIADWPYLNALLAASCGADLVAVHQNAGAIGGSASAGLTLIADGSAGAAERLTRALTADPGLGVVRHAEAGVPGAREFLVASGIATPSVADAPR